MSLQPHHDSGHFGHTNEIQGRERRTGDGPTAPGQEVARGLGGREGLRGWTVKREAGPAEDIPESSGGSKGESCQSPLIYHRHEIHSKPPFSSTGHFACQTI